jgi:hypothetical protein
MRAKWRKKRVRRLKRKRRKTRARRYAFELLCPGLSSSMADIYVPAASKLACCSISAHLSRAKATCSITCTPISTPRHLSLGLSTLAAIFNHLGDAKHQSHRNHEQKFGLDQGQGHFEASKGGVIEECGGGGREAGQSYVERLTNLLDGLWCICSVNAVRKSDLFVGDALGDNDDETGLLRSGIVSAKIMCVTSAFYRCCEQYSTTVDVVCSLKYPQ